MNWKGSQRPGQVRNVGLVLSLWQISNNHKRTPESSLAMV